MKISIIGAGNVGGTTAMRLAQEGLGDIFLIDIAKGLAQGKALDLDDCRPILKHHYQVTGTDDFRAVKDSQIVVVTAGLARKPGMTREDLLNKNSQILKSICLDLKTLSPKAILIIVTNPLDIMTYLALKVTGFGAQRVIGMGISLDVARFANLISQELKVSTVDVEAVVIGGHGEGMLPLPRFTNIKGVGLDEFIDEEKIQELTLRTFDRGKEIVSLLGSGSAYYAPSAAIAAMVKIIAKDEKRNLGACAYLNGEYGLRDICIGVPVRLGKNGIEEIIELELNQQEKETFLKSAALIKEQITSLRGAVGDEAI